MPISRDVGRRPWGFDMHFEVLCSIPWASFAQLGVLAKDHHLSRRQLDRIIANLITAGGYAIERMDKSVRVSDAGRAKVVQDCNEYWMRVWKY